MKAYPTVGGRKKRNEEIPICTNKNTASSLSSTRRVYIHLALYLSTYPARLQHDVLWRTHAAARQKRTHRNAYDTREREMNVCFALKNHTLWGQVEAKDGTKEALCERRS